MGANVIVTEVDPLKALEAVMDGFRVMPMAEAARVGDLFITLTGNKSVIRAEHFEQMKDGATVANSGHFNVEIDIDSLEKMKTAKRRVRQGVDEYTLPAGKRVHLLGEGRLINLAGAEGHPAAVMDMSFANQALCIERLVTSPGEFQPGVYPVPAEIDSSVASLKLDALDVGIDHLTEDQKAYLASWKFGT
jgi:adenosylhomocysteinase